MTDQDDTRRSPHLGTRLGLTAALLLLVFAAYHAWAPVDLPTRSGARFDCGSVIHPPHGAFQKSTCVGVVDKQGAIVVFSIIAAVVVAAGSLYAFGLTTSPRRPRRPRRIRAADLDQSATGADAEPVVQPPGYPTDDPAERPVE